MCITRVYPVGNVAITGIVSGYIFMANCAWSLCLLHRTEKAHLLCNGIYRWIDVVLAYAATWSLGAQLSRNSEEDIPLMRAGLPNMSNINALPLCNHALL